MYFGVFSGRNRPYTQGHSKARSLQILHEANLTLIRGRVPIMIRVRIWGTAMHANSYMVLSSTIGWHLQPQGAGCQEICRERLLAIVNRLLHHLLQLIPLLLLITAARAVVVAVALTLAVTTAQAVIIVNRTSRDHNIGNHCRGRPYL